MSNGKDGFDGLFREQKSWPADAKAKQAPDKYRDAKLVADWMKRGITTDMERSISKGGAGGFSSDEKAPKTINEKFFFFYDMDEKIQEDVVSLLGLCIKTDDKGNKLSDDQIFEKAKKLSIFEKDTADSIKSKIADYGAKATEFAAECQNLTKEQRVWLVGHMADSFQTNYDQAYDKMKKIGIAKDGDDKIVEALNNEFQKNSQKDKQSSDDDAKSIEDNFKRLQEKRERMIKEQQFDDAAQLQCGVELVGIAFGLAGGCLQDLAMLFDKTSIGTFLQKLAKLVTSLSQATEMLKKPLLKTQKDTATTKRQHDLVDKELGKKPEKEKSETEQEPKEDAAKKAKHDTKIAAEVANPNDSIDDVPSHIETQDGPAHGNAGKRGGGPKERGR